MPRENLEALFGDSYRDIKCADCSLTIKTIKQCEMEEALYKWMDSLNR